jgi:hypothetical protein
LIKATEGGDRTLFGRSMLVAVRLNELDVFAGARPSELDKHAMTINLITKYVKINFYN